MNRPPKDDEREERIDMEIIADAYGPDEQAMGWYAYLENTLEFPFITRCVAERAISPLRVDDEVEVIGALEELSTVASQFVLAPFVGLLPGRPTLVPNPAEVARVFDVSLAELLDDDVYHEERWELPGMGMRPMYFFDIAGETVWGATARILHDLLVLVTGSLR